MEVILQKLQENHGRYLIHSNAVAIWAGLYETIRKVLFSFKIRVIFEPHNSLRQQLMRVKNTVPMPKRANVVYSLSFSMCSSTYIGQTGRLLENRMNENKIAVKHARCETSAVAEHV